jgi:hypothetical protein
MAISESTPQAPEQSWGADLKQYASQKSSLPWDSKAVPPVSYVTTHEMSRKAREVDIILMQHRDATAEAAAALREQAKLQHALQTGRERAKRTQQRYDIVSHASRVEPGSTTKQEQLLLTKQQKRAPDTRTPYNIINNSDRAIHNGKPQPTSAAIPDSKSKQQKNKTIPANCKQREFNVLSNRFSADHESRVLQEAADTQQFIKGVYERTHNYNPVAVRYYDDAKEQQYQQAREKQAAFHGQAQQAKLPASVKNGDGRQYDIISKAAKPTTKTSADADTSSKASSMSKRTAGRQLAQKSIEERQAREAVAADRRALLRSSYTRYAADVSKGYNPITNEDYHGCKARAAPRGRNSEPAAPWEVLHDTQKAVDYANNKQSNSSSTQAGAGKSSSVTDSSNEQSVVSTGHAAVPELRLTQASVNAL